MAYAGPTACELRPDGDAIMRHCEYWYGGMMAGFVQVGWMNPATANLTKFKTFHVSAYDEMAEFIEETNSVPGQSIYMRLGLLEHDLGDKAAADSNFFCTPGAWVDIDREGGADEAKNVYSTCRPNIAVVTGRTPYKRVQFGWKFSEPDFNGPNLRTLNSRICTLLGGDPAAVNPTRLMRIGGTIAWPYKDGRIVERTETLLFEDRPRYYPAHSVALAFPEVKQPDRQSLPVQGESPFDAMSPEGKTRSLIRSALNNDNWHNSIVQLTSRLAAKGRTDEEIMLMAAGLTLPGYTVDDTLKEMKTALQGARIKYGANDDDSDTPDDKPEQELKVFDAFDFEEADIPVRPWIVPGAILSGYTHMMAAPGGSGKSLITLQFAIMLATGMQWGTFTPRRRCRSLIINTEDDIDEQRRRLAAAARVMGVDPQSLRGWIYLVDASDGIVVAGHDPEKRSLVMTPVVEKLCAFIEEHKIDVTWADPFTETFEGDENDNSEVKWAMRIWRDEVARKTMTAVYLVHHTTKYANGGAGDANIIRGAGAIVNSTRISVTLMPMTEDEAKELAIDKADRHLYVRYDDAKANQSLKSGTAKWFKKVSVELRNGRGLQEPDEVGALEPWTPPDAFDGLTLASIGTILDQIEEGMTDKSGTVTGVRYSATTRGGSKESGRWVGCLLMDVWGLSEERAKKVIGTWIKSGVLVEDEYVNPEKRSLQKGVFAPLDARPGVKT